MKYTWCLCACSVQAASRGTRSTQDDWMSCSVLTRSMSAARWRCGAARGLAALLRCWCPRWRRFQLRPYQKSQVQNNNNATEYNRVPTDRRTPNNNKKSYKQVAAWWLPRLFNLWWKLLANHNENTLKLLSKGWNRLAANNTLLEVKCHQMIWASSG